MHPSHHFLQCDVTSYASQCTLFTTALSLSPSKTLHTVVANAGVGELGDFIKPSPLTHDPPEPDTTTLDVNLKGVIYTTKLALHHFQRNVAGEDQHLLFVGSMASFASSPGVVALYTASKHAVLGFFRTLRLHPGNHSKAVRLNIICPYFVATPIIPTMGRVMLSGVELATSEDVVEAAARLVCDERARGRCLAIAPRGAGGVLEMDVESMKDIEAFSRRVMAALNAAGYVETVARWVVDMVKIAGVTGMIGFFGITLAMAWLVVVGR
jgi:short-subunit dehydrogenase